MFLAIVKLLVVRDGIELPTPAFSGPPTESRKWFEINGSHLGSRAYVVWALGSGGLVWAVYGCSMFAYCSRANNFCHRKTSKERYLHMKQ